MTEKQLELNRLIAEKLEAIGQNHEVHLEGLLWAKPITYWDYIHTDALLNLQVQRTTQPDEMVFIMYHQVNELLFKMILWEIDQVANRETLDATFFSERLMRITRYFDMLTSSFSIMQNGMETAQYMRFRTTLTPASGFQSAQYRLIEFASTPAANLVDHRFRANIGADAEAKNLYDHLYWQAAGKDHKTNKKSTLLRLFEEKYLDTFLGAIKNYRHSNLWSRYLSLPEADRNNSMLKEAMRHYDRTVNITWVMAHYYAAEKYLESNGNTAEATGGSDWKKYMHPKYQRRIFFPGVWSEHELTHWGENLNSK